MSELASVLEVAAAPNLRWWYRASPGETHLFDPGLCIRTGTDAIFADRAIPEGLF